ncbi:MAG TPA: hypothetical protein EYN90_06455, partial [Acidobacteria bacterium]|nr:hypothetical protein [Acidobacteriota bacterium]
MDIVVNRLIAAFTLSVIASVQFSCGGASVGDPADSESDVGSAAGRPAKVVITSAPELEPLAVSAYTIDGVSIELLNISRTGADAITIRWQYRTRVIEGIHLDAGDDPLDLARDAYLYDRVHKKKYMVIKDNTGQPVTNIHSDNTSLTITPDAPLVVSAKFPAPP